LGEQPLPLGERIPYGRVAAPQLLAQLVERDGPDVAVRPRRRAPLFVHGNSKKYIAALHTTAR
jgi:hypothetical protein